MECTAKDRSPARSKPLYRPDPVAPAKAKQGYCYVQSSLLRRSLETNLLAVTTFSGPAHAAAPDQVLGRGAYHAEGPGSFTDTTIRVAASDSTPGVGTDAAGTMSVTDDPSNNTRVSLEAEVFQVFADGSRRNAKPSRQTVRGQTLAQ